MVQLCFPIKQNKVLSSALISKLPDNYFSKCIKKGKLDETNQFFETHLGFCQFSGFENKIDTYIAD